MRYNHIALFAMILASKVCCKEEYSLNADNLFRWYGNRTGLWAGENYAFGDFGSLKNGTYSFRPTTETATSEEPKIVIDFKLFSETYRNNEWDGPSKIYILDILVEKIKLAPGIVVDGKLNQELLDQTKQMGRIAISLFIEKSKKEEMKIQKHHILKGLHSFLFALLNQTEVGQKKELAKELAQEFATGMLEQIEKFKSSFAFKIDIDKEQTDLVIDLTIATTELSAYGRHDNSAVYEDFCVNTQVPKGYANNPELSRPFSEYFFSKFFLGSIPPKKRDQLLGKLNLLTGEYAMKLKKDNEEKIAGPEARKAGLLKEKNDLIKRLEHVVFADSAHADLVGRVGECKRSIEGIDNEIKPFKEQIKQANQYLANIRLVQEKNIGIEQIKTYISTIWDKY